MKLLFLVTEDWYFVSHRLDLAKAAKAAGYDVAVATRISSHQDIITSAGIRILPLKSLRRTSFNPLRELAALFEILKIYRCEQPTLVHQVALKPVVYGSLIARLTKIRGRVNALGGLGFVFSSKRFQARLLRPILLMLFRIALKDRRSRLIVQNSSDYGFLTKSGIVDADRVHLIRGAGVDLESYRSSPMPDGTPVILLASRMLWDKGIGEFVAAARNIRSSGIAARFVLVGKPDDANPTSISRAQLEVWDKEGLIEWWGHRTDMPAVLSATSIFCLPSYYGEGLPKALIEAMACGRPIVTTNTPGCRELVNGDNGALVAPRDVTELTRTLTDLILDPERRAQMGQASRRIAEENYGLSHVISETLAVYKQLATL